LSSVKVRQLDKDKDNSTFYPLWDGKMSISLWVE